MKSKKPYVEDSSVPRSHNLQAVRQHLRNKLIEVGLNCDQHHSCSKKKHTKLSDYVTEDHSLPVIFSLKNTLTLKKDNNTKGVQITQQIFSERQLFIDSQSFLGCKVRRSTERPQEKPLSSFREKFERKMIEEVQLYKMEQMLPSLKRALRKEKLRTETDETILIRALRHSEKATKDTVHISPPRKMRIARSKTEEHKPKQQTTQVKKVQITQYKQLAPWGQSDQMQNWLQHF